MSDESFPPRGLAAFGSQMAQAWEKVFESFWQTLLHDPKRLSELAARMAEAGVGAVRGFRAPSGPDVARLSQDLGSLDQRLRAIEGQLKGLTDGLASMITYLEELQSQGQGGKKAGTKA